ncbi:substrate-binding domain-containing protein [candidate division KSB3 bacterium]|uniref:Substrate-binding domain-containing protein n=1 Tax=candidate division KSB3 bacterium TaxID=2044937 RepID=A0A9D5JX08_9BACT|nr:substrate-binding domain-containing protein [candidate division KSB3 bacterium]
MSKKTVILIVACLFMMGVTTVFAQEDLPVPDERYLIAFSNGEMSNSWRWAFVDSMQEWANKFRKLGPGIEFIWTNGDADAAKQLMDADTLLAQQPDILILSPFQDEPLDPIIDMATEADVPLMVIDRALVREPGVGTYFTNITQNFAFSGMHQAMYALEWLKNEYGEYKGNIVEIQGQIGSSPTTDQYVGFRAVLKHYPDVKIIATCEGGYSQSGGRKCMEGFLERFGPGEIDLVACHNDAEGLGAIEAIEAAGRDELLEGRIMGKDQMVEFVKEVLAGRALMTTECAPYYGPFAMPTAIKYLNGEETPPKIVYLPLRCWENPNDGIDLTPAENDAEILAEHIAYSEEEGLALVPPETGNYDGLDVDVSQAKGYDEVMVYSDDRSQWPEGIVDLQNVE